MIKEFKEVKSAAGKQKVPFALLFIEVILAIILIMEFVSITIAFDSEKKTFSMALSSNPIDYFVFVITALLLASVYFTISKKQPSLHELQKTTPALIKEIAKQKIVLAKDDPRVAALLLIQFAFVIVIAFAIAAWLDPAWQIIPWEKFNVMQPYTTLFNTLISLLLIAIFVSLYKYTKEYRISKK